MLVITLFIQEFFKEPPIDSGSCTHGISSRGYHLWFLSIDSTAAAHIVMCQAGSVPDAAVSKIYTQTSGTAVPLIYCLLSASDMALLLMADVALLSPFVPCLFLLLFPLHCLFHDTLSCRILILPFCQPIDYCPPLCFISYSYNSWVLHMISNWKHLLLELSQ